MVPTSVTGSMRPEIRQSHRRVPTACSLETTPAGCPATPVDRRRREGKSGPDTFWQGRSSRESRRSMDARLACCQHANRDLYRRTLLIGTPRPEARQHASKGTVEPAIARAASSAASRLGAFRKRARTASSRPFADWPRNGSIPPPSMRTATKLAAIRVASSAHGSLASLSSLPFAARSSQP